MPSDLDRRFDKAMAETIAPGEPLAATRDENGRMVITGLPSTLPGFFRFFCAQHAAAEAVVAGDERLGGCRLRAEEAKEAGQRRR